MHPLELWQAVVLGLVEGITEYLPVSSTGHLIIASSLMGLQGGPHEKAVDDFEIIIQGGAILAVLGLYWPSVVKMLKGLTGKDPDGFKLLVNLVIAFIPSAILGLLLKKWIDAHLFALAARTREHVLRRDLHDPRGPLGPGPPGQAAPVAGQGDDHL